MMFKIIDKKTGKEPSARVIQNIAKKGGLIVNDIDQFFLSEEGSIILMDDCGNGTYCDSKRFGVEINRLAELRDKIENSTLVELPEKAWIVERTPFGGNEIIEYEVTRCIYVKGQLQSIVVNNEYTKNYYIDIVEHHRHVRDSYLCFSYEEAEAKLRELSEENDEILKNFGVEV